MVQAVHIGGIKAAIRLNRIPALPDGGGTHLDFIQPAGVVLLQKQLASQIVLAVLRESLAGERCADEAG